MASWNARPSGTFDSPLLADHSHPLTPHVPQQEPLGYVPRTFSSKVWAFLSILSLVFAIGLMAYASYDHHWIHSSASQQGTDPTRFDIGLFKVCVGDSTVAESDRPCMDLDCSSEKTFSSSFGHACDTMTTLIRPFVILAAALWTLALLIALVELCMGPQSAMRKILPITNFVVIGLGVVFAVAAFPISKDALDDTDRGFREIGAYSDWDVSFNYAWFQAVIATVVAAGGAMMFFAQFLIAWTGARQSDPYVQLVNPHVPARW